MTTADHRVSVVTGASIGIGRAVAVALAQAGYYVALTARSEDGLARTLDQIKANNGEGAVYPADLGDLNAVAALARAITSDLGTVDVIANVAGVWHDDEKAFQGPLLHETPQEQVLNVLDVGIRAPMVLTALLLPGMVERKNGHVINISGTFSDGAKGWLHYYVSKKALENFTVGLAQEYRDYEIQVNCVSPSDVATEPYKRFYPEYAESALAPEEVAEVVMTLLAPACRNITGQIIEVRNRKDHG